MPSAKQKKMEKNRQKSVLASKNRANRQFSGASRKLFCTADISKDCLAMGPRRCQFREWNRSKTAAIGFRVRSLRQKWMPSPTAGQGDNLAKKLGQPGRMMICMARRGKGKAAGHGPLLIFNVVQCTLGLGEGGERRVPNCLLPFPNALTLNLLQAEDIFGHS